MWFRSLFGSLTSRPARSRPTGRPRFEALEDRLCPSAATFGPTVNWAAGDGPSSVAVGDFNGDGRSDLATANTVSDNVSVLLGDGNGTFGGAVTFAAGDEPIFVAVGDFNGDGRPDLAVANAFSDNVSVLLNTTPPTLPPAPVPPPMPVPRPVPPPATPSSAPALPAFTGAQVVGDILVLSGARAPGGALFTPAPRGSVALFTDLTGDGRGDVILVMPTLTLVIDGQTGRFMALSADDNGDGDGDLKIFNPDGTTTRIDGRTGLVLVF